MKIIFMGTPEFAVAFLETLHKSSHTISLVVTQPDKPKGRGQVLTAPPVKLKAIELGLPIAQPITLKDPAFHDLLQKAAADLLVVVAYRILPITLFPLAKFGAVNVHGSLLPKFRGAAPIQWAVATGEKETGVTVFQLDQEIDHGRILAVAKTPIGPEETAGDIFARLQIMGQKLLMEVLTDLENGSVNPQEQNHSLSTPAPKLKKEDGKLDWNLPVEILHARIRGFNPYPICFSIQQGTGKILRIHSAGIEPADEFKSDKASENASENNPENLAPGFMRISSDRYPIIGTGKGNLKLLEVQWEGKPKMRGPDFINGLQDRDNFHFELN